MLITAAQALTRTLAVCILVVGLGATMSACGGGDGDQALSKRDYIQRGNELQREASSVFQDAGGASSPGTQTSPAAAESHLAAFDDLIAGYEALSPPATWVDEHEIMVESLQAMRQAMSVISKAPASRTAIIATQLKRFNEAQAEFEQAVRDVNASR